GNSVARIDPRSNAVVARITTGLEPDGIAVGSGSVWVTNSLDGTVTRINPATNREAGNPIEAGSNPNEAAFLLGDVWVSSTSEGDVYRIDPSTNRILAKIHTGGGPLTAALVGGQVWVSLYDVGSV